MYIYMYIYVYIYKYDKKRFFSYLKNLNYVLGDVKVEKVELFEKIFKDSLCICSIMFYK